MNKLIAGITAARVRNSAQHAAMAAIGCAALSLFALNASAAAGPYEQSTTVDFKDLDLSKTADAKRLYRRLRLAASEVCLGYPDARHAPRNTPRGRCEHAAVTNAVAAIGHPNLTALHVAKTDTKLAQSQEKPASST